MNKLIVSVYDIAYRSERLVSDLSGMIFLIVHLATYKTNVDTLDENPFFNQLVVCRNNKEGRAKKESNRTYNLALAQ